MEKKKVAIIGYGRSGCDIHGAFFAGENNVWYEVVAVVDRLAVRREAAQQRFGCDVYEDYHALLERTDLDLVVNSSYSYQHYPITLELLEHGLSVVVEKPFAMRAAECDRMMAAAREHGGMLCVFQQSHFAPYYQRIRAILDSGVLGRLSQVQIRFGGYSRRWDWQCSQRFGGGCLYNTGPHPMEQALNFFDDDGMPTVVSRLDRMNSFGDAEDFAKILLLQPGKPVVDVEITSCNAYAEYMYLIQGSYGTLRANIGKIEYRYFDPAEAPEQKLTLESLLTEQNTPNYCSETLPWQQKTEELEGTAFDVAVREYYHNIYDHLTAGVPLVIRPEKIRQQIAVMEEIHRQNPLPVRY